MTISSFFSVFPHPFQPGDNSEERDTKQSGDAVVKYLLVVLSVIFFMATGSSGQTVSVPLSHWAYDVVERWEVRGLLDGVFNGSRPFSRREMAEYVSQALQRLEEKPQKFSRTDREQLRYLVVEFREELAALNRLPKHTAWQPRMQRLFRKPFFRLPGNYFYTNSRNLVTLHHGEFHLFCDPIFAFGSQDLVQENGGIFSRKRTSNGLLFRGSLGRYFGFFFNLTDNHVKDTRFNSGHLPPQVLEESGWPFLSRGSSGQFDFDDNMAYLTFNYKYFYLLYGREYNQWGVGHNGNLLLSTNAQLYDQIKFEVRYWRFKYTHITAALEYVSPDARLSMKSQPHVDVFWAGNRLELNLGRGWQIGLSEAVVYGNRSLQIGYLNPLSFFKSLEHYYGDRDNGVLGVDFEWRMRHGVKIFGEWFIDDITTGKLGSKFFGNKFGCQGGVFLVNPLSVPDIDLLVEYTRLKPYVYSHTYRDYNKYKHYDTILGSNIGPNSDDLLVRLRRRFSKFLQISLAFERYRHGSNPPDRNVGGDPDQPFVYGTDNRDVVFLDGLLTVQKVWSISAQYELLRNLFANLQYNLMQANSANRKGLFSFRLSWNFGQKDEHFRNIFPVSH